MVNIKQGDWVKMKADNCLTWTYDIETDSLFIYRMKNTIMKPAWN